MRLYKVFIDQGSKTKLKPSLSSEGLPAQEWMVKATSPGAAISKAFYVGRVRTRQGGWIKLTVDDMGKVEQ